MTLPAPFASAMRYVASIALLFVGWAAITRVLSLPEYLLPDPATVLETLVTERTTLAIAAKSTVLNAVIGGSFGIMVGAAIGCVAGLSKPVRWVVEPYLSLAQSFPRESLFPLFVVWLGFGVLPKMLSSALLACFPMAVITLDALSSTRADYLQLMASWKASRLQSFLYCRLPVAVPSMIGGLKVCLPLALIGAVLGEFLGGSEGLGYIIVSAGSAFRVDRIFAAIVVLAGAGSALVGLVELLRVTAARRYYHA
jgi:NitT/TauT family transport system permease protein